VLLLSVLLQAACAGAPAQATTFAPELADSARLFRGTFSADGRTLYYFLKVTPEQEDYRIYVSRQVNGRWSTGQRLDLGGDHSDLYPSVTSDGKRMVFASYRPAPGDTSSKPNAYLWYTERRGDGWGTPVFIGSAAKWNHYHSGPIIRDDRTIEFSRATPDYRSSTRLEVRWNGKEYGPATGLAAGPAARWRSWRPRSHHVWGGQLGPRGDFALLDISELDARGRRGTADVWVSFRRGEDWTEPVPVGGGVNRGGYENFVTFHPDGCSLVFVRDFSTFQRVSIEGALAEARGRAGLAGPTPLPTVEGTYRGAYIRAGKVQVIDAEFVRERDTLRYVTSTPDWPLRGRYRSVVTRDSGGRYLFRTPFGNAAAEFDALHGELSGLAGSGAEAASINLKRAVLPPAPAVVREDLSVTSGGVQLSGTFVRPANGPIRAALVFVPGRGCVNRGGGVRLLELLAAYGVAGVSFDKRGVGQSQGNCRYGTIEQFTGDVLAAYDALRARAGSDSVKVGMMGNSAGGWTIVRAAARATRAPDFLITTVGPTVSVEQQQRDNARYITSRLKFTPEQQKRAIGYMDHMFASGNQEARYREMQALVTWAKEVGFADQFFEDSDIPSSPAAVDSLWVVLNNYDPAPDLARLNLPMLTLFGEVDEVVPPAENVTALRRIAAKNPGLRPFIVVVPGGDHGLGVADVDGRFDRQAPHYLESIIEFLAEVGRAR
jgi:pimeloyl-ACP methyl ester carboxylesterase